MKRSLDPINRILDANINRAKEGLRVCEEIARFLLNNFKLTGSFKKLRHDITVAVKGMPGRNKLICGRDSIADVGFKAVSREEFKRRDYRDIFFANIQRAKESVRVLEEFCKLKDKKTAGKFKKIRYQIYEVEKKSAEKIINSNKKALL